MSLGRIPIPDHPALRPCPFCGREASVTPYRATATSPVEYSVGCWQEPNPFSHNSHWDDCLGPATRHGAFVELPRLGASLAKAKLGLVFAHVKAGARGCGRTIRAAQAGPLSIPPNASLTSAFVAELCCREPCP